jgi:hypothetical protein
LAQSTMTEKEFRTLLRMNAVCGTDAALRIAKEAGLEFAPEPVRLTERLFVSVANPPTLMLAMTEENWPTEMHRRLSYGQAAARHNAYPGLREATEELVEAIDNGRGELHEVWLKKLRDELAKGPKVISRSGGSSAGGNPPATESTVDDILNGPGGYPSPSLGTGIKLVDQLVGAARAEGAAARQEEIRQALLAEADRINDLDDSTPEASSYDEHADVAIAALREFAATLEPRTP